MIRTLIAAVKHYIAGPQRQPLKRMGPEVSQSTRHVGLIDLHMHSWHSDGFFSPTYLAESAHSLGITTVALTDHDTSAGTAEMQAACASFGITAIPAVELSTRFTNHRGWKEKLEILGYHMTFKTPELLDRMSDIATKRKEYMRRYVVNWAHDGIVVTSLDIETSFPPGLSSRAQFAEILRRKGIVKSVYDGLWLQGPRKMWDRQIDGPVFDAQVDMEKAYFTFEEAIRLIHADGGIPILAHPTKYPFWSGGKAIFETIEKGLWGPSGLMGLELSCSRTKTSDFQTTAEYIALLNKKGIQPLLTYGSDFHDGGRDDRLGGVNLSLLRGFPSTETVLSRLEAAREDKSIVVKG